MSTNTPGERPSVDIDQCDKEPIHIPGAIQPHGVLLVLSEPEFTILQASANTSSLLGVEAHALLGRRLETLLDEASLQSLREALRGERPGDDNPLAMTVGARAFDGIVHRHQGATLLELEPVLAQESEGASFIPLHRRLRRALARVQSASNLLELCRAAAIEVRQLTGFERVHVYRFDEDDHGEVVAEEKSEGLDAYLGQHYPSADIPRQARELYLRNWLRLIPDRDYSPAPLIPVSRPDTGEPLDLSHSVLRSVSPVHVEYMRNMGVRASMSISLAHEGRLWGLIMCADHSAPRHVPYEVRNACELVGRVLSQQIGAVAGLEERQLRARVRGLEAGLVEAMRAESGDGTLMGLLRRSDDLLALAGAGGVAVVTREACHTAGNVPEPEALQGLVAWLRAQPPRDVLATRALSHDFPPAQAFQAVGSGLLALCLPKPVPEYVLWFRPEVVRTVSWGGNPVKVVEQDGDTSRLHPRRSFALWREEVHGTCLPWTPAQVEGVADLRRHALELDLVRQVLREQEAVQARDDLVAVVSHDLKNPLGAIQVHAGLIMRALPLGEEGPWRRVQTYAERLQRSAERMNTLIRDLLDLSKIEAGRVTLDARPENAAELIEEALEALRPLAEQKRLTLTWQPPELSTLVSADRDRIFQVLSNLLGNAIKFTLEGGAVHLGVTREGGQVRFSVQDTGPGIPTELQPYLFNRYWQAPRDVRGGSGLGLYISKGIVEAHGGRIWVESEPGVGSVFHFTLPGVDGPIPA
jgi:light-regulated signal transduction histidine kinase (bacteriophytochrome)